ncbi:hypothetical protein KAFR_0E01480 [Kazachstania africana CBS 2517]|uniref:Phosphatidic acid phosphatase type 2/haloperoxidase domain-containing protein n=1 Tax=Kazachstania africana (strain ATCC 22294 / BCRC 22015 / CBS 2517 / CECT 1963 / NBRC 1671 / NRRL Y-8276) TaxID=1071382 RepID=H2AVA2_KAZAF|nr:hypothetical protein KAFR_0E01480 [Kazachstania africana CBS 2517]CCF58302.1 hypothetical protein KAFR_0E01480 [Kazachstania africana CBS 2517]
MAIDRLRLGGNERSFSYRTPKWRISDVILLSILVIFSYPVYYQKPFERQFSLNDLTISHPYTLVERVSDTMLFVYSLVVPLIVVVAIGFAMADSRHRNYLVYISVLGLLVTWFSTTLFTNFIKNWIGRLRPDFLDRCQPKANLPLNIMFYASEVCTNENSSLLLDGFRTTPSGHSSASFAGLGYLQLWLSGQLLIKYDQVGFWRTYVAMLPLLGASLIALSRTQDYRHHFIDVLIGSVLGYWIAYSTYRRYFPALGSSLPFKPLLDDSKVGLVEEAPMSPQQQSIITRTADEEMQPLTDDENVGI